MTPEPEKGLYRTEQEGLLSIERVLIGFCVAMIPGFCTIFAANQHMPQTVRPWAVASILLDLPAFFTLVWHAFRWPLRLDRMRELTLAECQAMAREQIRLVKRSKSKFEDEVYGGNRENLLQATDDTQHVMGNMADISQRVLNIMADSLTGPEADNIITVYSRRIGDAERAAKRGRLPERAAQVKRVVDLFSRYTRHPFFAATVIVSAICVIKLIQR